jgi:hypothetical protein
MQCERWGSNPGPQGLKVHGATNENTGPNDGMPPQRQQFESVSLQTDDRDALIKAAKESIRSSRQGVEKLIDSIPTDDHYILGILGRILSGLLDVERVCDGI